MPIENQTMAVKSKAGSPNYRKLHEEGRMPEPVRDDGICSAFDPNPSPKEEIKSPVRGQPGEYNVKIVSRGYARGPDNIWRVNYSAQEHLDNMLKAQENAEIGKDTSFVPELHPEEEKDFMDFLSSQNLRISRGVIVPFEKKEEPKEEAKKGRPVKAPAI